MTIAMTVLAVLISTMFIGTIAFSLREAEREAREYERVSRHRDS